MKRQWTRSEKWLWGTPILVGLFAVAALYGPQLARDSLGEPQVWTTTSDTKIRSMALSANGEILAAAGIRDGKDGWLKGSGTVYLWNARTGEQLPPIAPVYTRDKTGFVEGSNIYGMAFSPDARQIGFTRRSGEWALYDVATRQPLWRFPQYTSGAAFSPDGRAIALSIDKAICIVDARNGRVETQWQNGRPYSYDISWSPDGKWVAHIGDHKAKDRIEIHRAEDGKIVRRLRGAQDFKADTVTSVEFAPDNKSLVVAGSVSNSFGERDFSTYAPVRCFDIQTGKLRWQIKAPALGGTDGQHASVCDAVFSPDGKIVAVLQFNRGTIFLIDSATGTIRSTLALGDAAKTNSYATPGLAFSPDGKRLFVRGKDAVLVWDLN